MQHNAVLKFSVYRIWIVRQKVKDMKRIKQVVIAVMVGQVVLSVWFQVYAILDGDTAYFDPTVVLCWPTFTMTPGKLQNIAQYYMLVIPVVGMFLTTAINIAIALYVKFKTLQANRADMQKMLITLTTIIWVFVASFSGHIVNAILGYVITFDAEQHTLDLVMVYLISLNVVLNPFIYVLTNKHFRTSATTFFRSTWVVTSAVQVQAHILSRQNS